MDQASVRWHLAQILGEVPLDADQRVRAIRVLQANLEQSDDWLVLNLTMQSLTTLAAGDPGLQRWLVPVLFSRLTDRRPAVAKRAAGQLARLAPAPERMRRQ